MVQVGQRIGVTHGALSRIENGKAGIAAGTLQAIAQAIGVDVAELLGAGTGVEYATIRGDELSEIRDALQELSWPDVYDGDIPQYFPGSLASFVGSVAAELAELGPDEVPMLARFAVVSGPPEDDAGWVRQLSIMRLMLGTRGRPIMLEIEKREEASDAAP